MKIQRKIDIVDHILTIMLVIFVFWCVMIVKTTKQHYDKNIAAPKTIQSMYPEIPRCDKELWERVTAGCKDGQ